jgi:hypothetical protein
VELPVSMMMVLKTPKGVLEKKPMMNAIFALYLEIRNSRGPN